MECFQGCNPNDLTGACVLDIGPSDRFYTIEMAHRGAKVVAEDAAGKAIKRLAFAAEALGLSDRITTRVGFIEDMPTGERYDFVLFLWLLYHLPHPLLRLETIEKVADLLYIESVTTPGDKPLLYLKPPQAGVHHVPKGFPIVSRIEEMSRYVGFSDIDNLNSPIPNRAGFVAKR